MSRVGYIVVNPAYRHPGSGATGICVCDDDSLVYADGKLAEEIAADLREEHENPEIHVLEVWEAPSERTLGEVKVDEHVVVAQRTIPPPDSTLKGRSAETLTLSMYYDREQEHSVTNHSPIAVIVRGPKGGWHGGWSLTLDQAEELSQTLLAWTRIAREQREKGKEPAKGGA